MPQARKKARKAPAQPDHMARRVQESIFLFSILLAVYLFASLVSYDPLDPGPFATAVSDQVNNTGRVLGAWLANCFLFLTGYIAYLLPLVVVYAGWSAYSDKPADVGASLARPWLGWLTRFSGLILFILSSTGLTHLHTNPAAGTMPAGGGGIIGQQIALPMLQLTGALGATLFLLALVLVGITLFTGLSWFSVMDGIGKFTLAALAWVGKSVADLRDWFAAAGEDPLIRSGGELQ